MPTCMGPGWWWGLRALLNPSLRQLRMRKKAMRTLKMTFLSIVAVIWNSTLEEMASFSYQRVGGVLVVVGDKGGGAPGEPEGVVYVD